MVIDWEHHYVPEELWCKKGGKKGSRETFYEHGKPRGTLHPELYDIEGHLRMMDDVGIDIAVLSMAVTNDHTQTALEECVAWDNDVSEVIKRYPKRFAGLAPIPPLGGEKAFSELDRAVNDLGLKGVVIRSQVEGLLLDSKELYPFYKKVSMLHVPIFIHPSGVQLGYDVLNAPYELGRSIGREIDLMVATTRMILSGVLEDFPELKLVISHLGGGISAIKERIDYYFGPRGMTGTRMSMPFQYYFEKLYFDLAGYAGGMNAVKCALTTIRPDRLVFATDYPQNFLDNPGRIKTYIDHIKSLDLDEEEKKQILGENAKGLLQ